MSRPQKKYGTLILTSPLGDLVKYFSGLDPCGKNVEPIHLVGSELKASAGHMLTSDFNEDRDDQRCWPHNNSMYLRGVC